jgi:hypothetical protein
VPGLRKPRTKQIAAQKTLQNLQQKWQSCLGILRHFGEIPQEHLRHQ